MKKANIICYKIRITINYCVCMLLLLSIPIGGHILPTIKTYYVLHVLYGIYNIPLTIQIIAGLSLRADKHA